MEYTIYSSLCKPCTTKVYATSFVCGDIHSTMSLRGGGSVLRI